MPHQYIKGEALVNGMAFTVLVQVRERFARGYR